MLKSSALLHRAALPLLSQSHRTPVLRPQRHPVSAALSIREVPQRHREIDRPFYVNGTYVSTLPHRQLVRPYQVDGDSVLHQCWTAYKRSLEQNPITVKALTCCFGALTGDVIAQMMNPLWAISGFDMYRSMTLSLFALLIGGTTGHMWHKVLDANVFPASPTSTKAVLSKLVLDQAGFAPLINTAFLTWLHLFSGGSLATALPYLAVRLPPLLMANYTIWPLANLIAFKFIPGDYRILYCNVLAVFWGTYVSLLTCGAA